MLQFRRSHIVILSLLCTAISAWILIQHPGREPYIPPKVDSGKLTGEITAESGLIRGPSAGPRPRILLSGESEHGEYRIVQYIPVRGPIDVNRAPEALLCTLPGIGPGKARQITEIRQELGGFKDFDHFQQSIRLEAHLVEAIRPVIQFGSLP